MNYWLRLVIQVVGGLVTYMAVNRFIKPMKSWLWWMLGIFVLNSGIVLLSEYLIVSLGWTDLYTRLVLETISIGIILALMPRQLMMKPKPKDEAPVALEQEKRPPLKKRKKPKI